MSENSISEGFKMTEFGHLPKVWEVVKFGDKGHFQYGYTTSATDENTGTKFLRITDIKEDGIVNWGTVPYGSIDDNNLQKFRLSKGDILFARIGATTGKTCIIGGAIPNAVFASYLIRFVPDKELHPKYVFYFTQTREYQELVNAGKEGKLKKGLSATELKNFNIPLPPLPEQRAIAKVLFTVQQAKEKTNAVISTTKELKKSMMKHLFSYGPVPVKKFNEFCELDEFNELQNAQNSNNSSNSSNSKNSINLKETEIGLVPEEWDVVRLGDVAEQRKETTNPRDGDWKYVGLEHIDPGESHLKRYGFSNEVRSSKSKFYSGDILYGKLRPYLDKGVLVDFEGICSTDIIVIKTKENLNETLLAYLVHINEFREYATKTMTGVNHPRTSWRTLSQFYIPLPPLSIQQKIASILSTADKKIEVEQTKRKALDELFKSLLHNLMTGKVRVNHLVVIL